MALHIYFVTSWPRARIAALSSRASIEPLWFVSKSVKASLSSSMWSPSIKSRFFDATALISLLKDLPMPGLVMNADIFKFLAK
eukprot:CAMPEP_0185578134 /NCGR_PEP_ID=MMETSP0434-20130131/12119_1 /TAXON_ID=626734 ORGANISM="Favella taraikaensis, Strain Fe Narragansett Bay" /NCGR_SAMPLE_ID=MMETSP0434 /ASSEMBLY_ACC=CAM_ASM_000379 /LENGTH=82 /DNA_ID=CAMNT_0028195881 /DNA_START=369 /DNA_END=614 /DNA_ORIENTATION=-